MANIISSLAKTSHLEIVDKMIDNEKLKSFPNTTIASSGIVIVLKTDNLANLEEKNKQLEKELTNLDAQIKRTIQLLSSDFGKKAPVGVIEKEKQKLAGLESAAEKVRQQLGK